MNALFAVSADVAPKKAPRYCCVFHCNITIQ